MQITFILSMVFAVIIAFFAVLNSEPVTINLFFEKFVLSQAIVILLSAVLGAVIVFLLNIYPHLKGKVKFKNAIKQNKELEAKLEKCVKDLESLNKPEKEDCKDLEEKKELEI